MTGMPEVDDLDAARRRRRLIENVRAAVAEALKLSSRPIKEAETALPDTLVKDLSNEAGDDARRSAVRSAVENRVVSVGGGAPVATKTAELQGLLGSARRQVDRDVAAARERVEQTPAAIDRAAPIDPGVRNRTTLLLVAGIALLVLFVGVEFYCVAGPFVGALRFTQSWFGAVTWVWPASGTTLVLLTAYLLTRSGEDREARVRRMLGLGVRCWFFLLIAYGVVGGGLHAIDGESEPRQWLPLEALTAAGPVVLAIATYCLKDLVQHLWKRRFPLVAIETAEAKAAGFALEAALADQDDLTSAERALERLQEHLRRFVDHQTDLELARVNSVRRSAELKRQIRGLQDELGEG